jgi:hypothetical protein
MENTSSIGSANASVCPSGPSPKRSSIVRSTLGVEYTVDTLA